MNKKRSSYEPPIFNPPHDALDHANTAASLPYEFF